MNEAPENNVVEYLRLSAELHPQRVALVLPDNGSVQQITFAELWEDVCRVSNGLKQGGLDAKQRAILMVPMSIDLYVLMLAVIKNGAACVFVDPWMKRKQIGAFVAFAEPAAYLGIPKAHLLRWLDRRLGKIPISVTTGATWGGLVARVSLRHLRQSSKDESIHPVSSDEPALITFTGGSSGMPKGANRTHRFLAAQHNALSHEFPYDDGDIDMPMFPVFALNNLASGRTSIVPQIDFRKVAATDGAVIAEQMKTHGVNCCTASPPFFDRLVDAIEQNDAPSPKLRRILTGGAPVTDEQLIRWQQYLPGTEIIVAYGSTEAEPVAHLNANERRVATRDRQRIAPGYCTGKLVGAVRGKVIRIHQGPISLDDWSAWELPVGEIGELCVSGDHVGRDYYNNPTAVAENKIIAPDGDYWHRMGDTGYFDEGGYFWLTGRVHSTITRASVQYHPQLLEQAARGDERRIEQIAAVGVVDKHLHHRIVIVVNSFSRENIENDIRQRIANAGFLCDDVIVRNTPLPVDPRHNTKIDYNVLRQEIEAALVNR